MALAVELTSVDLISNFHLAGGDWNMTGLWERSTIFNGQINYQWIMFNYKWIVCYFPFHIWDNPSH